MVLYSAVISCSSYQARLKQGRSWHLKMFHINATKSKGSIALQTALIPEESLSFSLGPQEAFHHHLSWDHLSSSCHLLQASSTKLRRPPSGRRGEWGVRSTVGKQEGEIKSLMISIWKLLKSWRFHRTKFGRRPLKPSLGFFSLCILVLCFF